VDAVGRSRVARLRGTLCLRIGGRTVRMMIHDSGTQ
jgi:hypothetical protein